MRWILIISSLQQTEAHSCKWYSRDRNPSSLAQFGLSTTVLSSQVCLLTSVRCHPQISTSFPSVYQHTSQSSHLGTPHHSLQVPRAFTALVPLFMLLALPGMSFLLFLTRKLLFILKARFSVICSVTHVLFPSWIEWFIPSPSDPIASCLYYTMS